MKKYVLIIISLVIIWLTFDWFYYHFGVLYIPHQGEISSFTKVEGSSLLLNQGDGFEKFEIKGVDLGLGKPGYYATEKAVTKEEYLRWFKQIKELGANVIRTYTLAGPEFYEAFFEFNMNNPDPLYLLHGVWVDDYLLNSTYSAFDKEFYEPIYSDCKKIVDVIHGRHKESQRLSLTSDNYKWDISQWVCGYILGVEWDGNLVTYTDKSFPQQTQFDGKYFYTENGTNFEIFLASMAENTVAYETEKYGSQRWMAFSNWAITDPLDYPEELKEEFQKSASVDVEHIRTNDSFIAGQFASYHLYPYYPDYYASLPLHEDNTYLQYLRELTAHHQMPVVISEFGVPSSRGLASREEGLGRNQGNMSETQQGDAIVSMYHDIKEANCAGAVVFTWQDEWFKRTWNTMASIDLNATPYWSDYQANEQNFGLLSFDPGKEKSISYPDGNKSEWNEEDLISDQNQIKLSMKYDEKYIYYLIEKEGLNIKTDRLFIPIDTTPKSGSKRAENLQIEMNKDADFMIDINGVNNSRVWVQDYYDSIDVLYSNIISGKEIFSLSPPQSDSEFFKQIRMIYRHNSYYKPNEIIDTNSDDDIEINYDEFGKLKKAKQPCYRLSAKTFETGKLTHGNGNPESSDFNSLTDFCVGDGFVELRIPWQLLNFADPSSMKIHDDYYENYGVEYLDIDEMYVGVGDGSQTIEMEAFPLKPLGKNPSYHERLKKSYYILQSEWAEN